MSDIVAQIEVLSRETGCLIDLSAIVDLAVCPKIDIKPHKPHKVEENDDYICVTPTEDSRRKTKRCDRPDHSCGEVPSDICKKNHVALDMEILVILGLLTEEQLEKYLKTMGEMDEDDHMDMGHNKDMKMDPLLSLGVGDHKSILDAELAGPDGLLNVKLGDKQLLNLGGKGPLLNLGGKGKGLLGLGGALKRRGIDKLANVLVGGKAPKESAPVELDALTHGSSRMARDLTSGLKDKLAHVQAGGKKPSDSAPIELDALTKDVEGLVKRKNKKLIDIGIGGESNPDKATIDLDLLQHPPKKGGNGSGSDDNDDGSDDNGNGSDGNGDGSDGNGDGSDGNGNGNNGSGNGHNGSGNGHNGSGNGHNGSGNGHNGSDSGSEIQPGNSEHPDPYYLSLYQPLCNKGFKKEHRDHADHCHSQDANHCLALCHSKAALLTLEADAKVGDVANILVCAAVEFDNGEDGDNCHYFVAPEHEPCHDDELEEKKDCYTFVRN